MRLSMIVLALCGCEVKSEDTTPRPLPPDPGPPTLVQPAPEGCTVALGLIVDGTGERIGVTATARNLGSAAVTMEAPDRCPGQPARLRGLPDGHDPDETCTMGACARDAATVRWELGPGETVALAAWTLRAGEQTCNAPLAGEYALEVDPTGMTVVGAPDAQICADPAVGVALSAPRAKPKCEPMPACGIGCPGPMAKDANGCTLCACEKDPFAP